MTIRKHGMLLQLHQLHIKLQPSAPNGMPHLIPWIADILPPGGVEVATHHYRHAVVLQAFNLLLLLLLRILC